MHRPRNVLVVYSLLMHPLRATTSDHLYCFRRYGNDRYFYVNVGARRVPRWLRRIDFDAVLFHHTLIAYRFESDRFLDWQLGRAKAVAPGGAYRLGFAQDECFKTDRLRDFVNDFEIDHMFTLAPESEVPKIYAGVDTERTSFSRVLPGYLSEETTGRIERIVAEGAERDIDIGYRSWKGGAWLGSQGHLRVELARLFAAAAAANGLTTDLSLDPADVFAGDDWYRFLARCRYTISVEGGASVLDVDGSIKECTESYEAEHPDAPFADVEAACFPGRDGELDYVSISPRHLEACATRTCQVLVEGDYSGVLEAGKHYIPLRRDLSNVDEAIELIRSDSERERITEAAYEDVVASGRWTYRGLVDEVESRIAAAREEPRLAETPALARRHRRAEASDRRSWRRVRAAVGAARAGRAVTRKLRRSP